MKDLDLNTIYKAILETGWLITDEKGLVYRNLSATSGEEKEAFVMLEKAVALPTRENLARSGRDNLLIFHPLMEGLLGGESPVIGKLRRAYGIRFTFAAAALFGSLLGGVTHETEYNKFSPDQMDLLTTIKNVDAGTIKTWDKLVEMSIDRHGMSNAFADVYIKRDKLMNGQSYSRIATVRFPIYNELVNNPDKIFGGKFKPSTSDRNVIIKLFEYMFPNIAVEDAYTVGTNSRIAPYLDSLLGVFGKLFKIINTIYGRFSDVVIFDEAIKVELEWLDWFRDIESLKNLAQSVPQQFGNYPVKVEDDVRAETGTQMAQQQPERTQAAQPQQQQAAQQYVPQQQAQPFAQAVPLPATPEQPKFQGIGRPIAGVTSSVQKPQISTKAVFIEGGNTARNLADPMAATVSDAIKIARTGGVGRVSALEARPNQVSTQANIISNTPLNGGPVNNNGWNTNSSNGFGQQGGGVSSSLILREAALQNLMSNGSPFNTMGGFQTTSVI